MNRKVYRETEKKWMCAGGALLRRRWQARRFGDAFIRLNASASGSHRMDEATRELGWHGSIVSDANRRSMSGQVPMRRLRCRGGSTGIAIDSLKRLPIR
jgi:hypothetical protein